MRRRKFLLMSVSVIAAGCTKSPQDRTTTDTHNETTTSSFTSETTETATSTRTTRETSEELTPWTRLKVRFEVTMEAALRLERLPDAKVVYEERREYTNGETVDLSQEFDPDTDYRFTISNLGGEPIFDLKIYDYEGYELAVVSENEVEIVNHEEV